MLRALAVIMPVAALYDLVSRPPAGAGSMRPTVIVDNLGRLGLQAVAVLVVYLAGGGPLALVLAWSLPYVLGLVVAGGWLRGPDRTPDDAPGRPPRRGPPWPASSGPSRRRARSRGSPRPRLKRSDIVLVAALASPAEAALYTAATRFIVVGQLFVQAVQQALSPHLSALFARGETRPPTRSTRPPPSGA